MLKKIKVIECQCRECGKIVKEDDNFCSKCGHQLTIKTKYEKATNEKEINS